MTFYSKTILDNTPYKRKRQNYLEWIYPSTKSFNLISIHFWSFEKTLQFIQELMGACREKETLSKNIQELLRMLLIVIDCLIFIKKNY